MPPTLHRWCMGIGLRNKKKHIVLCNMEKMAIRFCTNTLVIFATCAVDLLSYQNHTAIAARRWTEVTAMRLIDRDAINWRPDEHLELYAKAADIRAIPIVDAVVVTRCKDCKHSTLPSELTQRYGKPGTLTCHNMHAPSNRRNVGSNDFCSYGEPKEG